MHRHDHPNHPSAFEVYWTRRRMWIAVTWSVMVGALAVSYYCFVFLPQEQRLQDDLTRQAQQLQAKIEQDKVDEAKALQDATDRAKADNQMQLQTCLRDVEQSYTDFWDRECRDRNMAPDCRLPTAVSDQLNQFEQTEKANCFKEFPQT